jgi:hypothetical protein
MNKAIELHKKAFEFVNSGKIGEQKYNSTQEPFFQQNPTKSGDIGNKQDGVNVILENISLPTLLQKIYLIIGDPTIEFYHGEWNILQLEDVKKRVEIYKSKNQNRAVDFAIKYEGMGHITVISYDPELDMIYFRHDGGSNGYDREFYHNFAVKYVPEKDKCMTIENWIENISNESLYKLVN